MKFFFISLINCESSEGFPPTLICLTEISVKGPAVVFRSLYTPSSTTESCNDYDPVVISGGVKLGHSEGGT